MNKSTKNAASHSPFVLVTSTLCKPMRLSHNILEWEYFFKLFFKVNLIWSLNMDGPSLVIRCIDLPLKSRELLQDLSINGFKKPRYRMQFHKLRHECDFFLLLRILKCPHCLRGSQKTNCLKKCLNLSKLLIHCIISCFSFSHESCKKSWEECESFFLVHSIGDCLIDDWATSFAQFHLQTNHCQIQGNASRICENVTWCSLGCLHDCNMKPIWWRYEP